MVAVSTSLRVETHGYGKVIYSLNDTDRRGYSDTLDNMHIFSEIEFYGMDYQVQSTLLVKHFLMIHNDNILIFQIPHIFLRFDNG